MDLEALGRPRAARLLLAAYRDAGGDPGADELVWFHAAHWALVRSKVAVIAGIERVHTRAGDVAAPELRDLAERLAWRARGRFVLAIAGPPASGKSTLAQGLAVRSGLPVLSSDIVRKDLAGVPSGARAGDDVYSDEFTLRTYRALCDSARRLVESG